MRASKAIELCSFFELFHLLDVHDHKDTIERMLNGQSISDELPRPYADAVQSACSVRGDAVYEDVVTILEVLLRMQLSMAERIENVPCLGSPKLTMRLKWS